MSEAGLALGSCHCVTIYCHILTLHCLVSFLKMPRRKELLPFAAKKIKQQNQPLSLLACRAGSAQESPMTIGAGQSPSKSVRRLRAIHGIMHSALSSLALLTSGETPTACISFAAYSRRNFPIAFLLELFERIVTKPSYWARTKKEYGWKKT